MSRVFYILISLSVFLLSCGEKKKRSDYSYNKAGYWYKLISFEKDTQTKSYGKRAWVEAVFLTQNDSVFYDSRNDLRDRFFVKIDSSTGKHLLRQIIAKSEKGDSLSVLIRPDTFFLQQFQSGVPFFSSGDSIVKINLKIKDILTETDYKKIVARISRDELSEIEHFFGSPKDFELARDPLGFYWVERPQTTTGDSVKPGTSLTISYSGGFLDGRIIDNSPPGFQIIYGTPDQLLKGLNYVIQRLKTGQTSKIILPSHLAFGESGSSNGSVPPFTPMLYKITINN